MLLNKIKLELALWLIRRIKTNSQIHNMSKKDAIVAIKDLKIWT